MKKLFFTAIALVAFSGVSMASSFKNSLFSKEYHSFEKRELNFTKILLKDIVDCGAMAQDLISIYEDEFGCLESSAYNSFYTIMLHWCNNVRSFQNMRYF